MLPLVTTFNTFSTCDHEMTIELITKVIFPLPCDLLDRGTRHAEKEKEDDEQKILGKVDSSSEVEE